MTATTIRLAATRLTIWAKSLLTASVTASHRIEAPAAVLPGVIGSAVITALRRSAGLSRHDLARRLGSARAIIHSWEVGTIPLYCVPHTTLEQLAETMSHEAFPFEVILSELLLAVQCDYLIASLLLGDEDFADVPPIDEITTDGAAARQLIRWAISGPAPDRYQHLAPKGPLLASPASERVVRIARDLAARPDAPQIAVFGRTLQILTRDSESCRLTDEP